MIYYIGLYDTLKKPNKRVVSPACCNKMEYIAKVVKGLEEIRIISIAEPSNNKIRITPPFTIEQGNGISVKFLPTMGGKGRLVAKIKPLWQELVLLVFFLINVRKEDKVLLYHTTSCMRMIIWLKSVLKFSFILEVEEIYDKVSYLTPSLRKQERRIFQVADSFIFASELLPEQVEAGTRPFVVVNGNYTVQPEIVPRYNDGKIHVVYSGTFNPRKGGAKAAIESAIFLNENYHLHIAGWGSENEVKEVEKYCRESSLRTNCKISFDGFVEESDFGAYIQKCHIGLCTQNPNDSLSLSCFPSKILMYMGNGLSVVSSKTPAIQNSKINDYISLYSEQTGRCIADAIKCTIINNDNREVLKKMDTICTTEIASLLQ